MWKTAQGDVLRLPREGLSRIAGFWGVDEEVLLSELRRIAPRAARAGGAVHRRSGAVHPVFKVRDRGRTVRFVTRPHGPAPRHARFRARPHWRYPWRRYWPFGYWPWPSVPGYTIVSVDADGAPLVAPYGEDDGSGDDAAPDGGSGDDGATPDDGGAGDDVPADPAGGDDPGDGS